jgi:2'-5' RNA ligase
MVVVVEAAEPAVGDLRNLHDPMAARGVPAHITLLYPFRPNIDATTVEQVATIARRISPFEVTFADVGRFPGELVFLAPEPAAAFSEIIRHFIETFPDCPPYGGAHPDPIPHLTVASDVGATTAQQIAVAVASRLPISTAVDHVTLLVEDDRGDWTIDRSWPLLGVPSASIPPASEDVEGDADAHDSPAEQKPL